jgi:hypothetical protein
MTTARFVVNAARRPATSPHVPRQELSRGGDAPAPPPADPASRKLPAARIAVWQAALVVGFAGIGRGTAATVAAAVTAVLVLALSAVRIRGEWLSAVGAGRLSFVLRRRTRDGDWLPLPRGSVITPDGVIAGADGLTVVTRTVRMEVPHLEADAGGPELDLQFVAHLGPGEQQPLGWLAITARRSPDTGSDQALRVALDNALRRLRKAERAAGRPGGYAALGAADLRPALMELAHAGVSRESWHHWRSGSTTQISLRARTTRPDALLGLLREARGAAVTFAMRTRAGNEGVLRIAARSDDAAERAVARLIALGTPLGVRLDRLDGRHGPAVLASLPIGGSL